eukprot:1628258-Amphidinium_carterae.1
MGRRYAEQLGRSVGFPELNLVARFSFVALLVSALKVASTCCGTLLHVHEIVFPFQDSETPVVLHKEAYSMMSLLCT